MFEIDLLPRGNLNAFGTARIALEQVQLLRNNQTIRHPKSYTFPRPSYLGPTHTRFESTSEEERSARELAGVTDPET